MSWLATRVGRTLARYLERPSRNYEPFSVTDPQILQAMLRPGDVLLIDGNQRISVAIKYLTQSTWSHAAIYVGDAIEQSNDTPDTNTLIEADLVEGVIPVPLSKYADYNTRICRPVGLSDEDKRKVMDFVIDAIGMEYDLQNIIDLGRYLLPTPPVPVRWRRRLLAFGGGDPTRAICSTLLAQAFQSVQYPVLPHIRLRKTRSYATGTYTEREILHIRHHSLFTPRDFDLSPYFRVVKPTLEAGFDYKQLTWSEDKTEQG